MARYIYAALCQEYDPRHDPDRRGISTCDLYTVNHAKQPLDNPYLYQHRTGRLYPDGTRVRCRTHPRLQAKTFETHRISNSIWDKWVQHWQRDRATGRWILKLDPLTIRAHWLEPRLVTA